MPIFLEKDVISIVLGARDVGIAEVSNYNGIAFIQLDRAYKTKEKLPNPEDLPEPYKDFPKIVIRFDTKGSVSMLQRNVRKIGLKMKVRGFSDAIGESIFENAFDEIGEHQDRMRRVIYAAHDKVPVEDLEQALGMTLEEFCEEYACNKSILKVKEKKVDDEHPES